MIIDSFSGGYRFLSNFWYCPVVYDGVTYPTNEHAFQAAKTLSEAERKAIEHASTPGEAKRLGRAVTLREDWERVKIDVMRDLNRQKFAYPTLRAKLLETGDASLIEGNHWGDRFWGVCDGQGQNWLGRILMEARRELQGGEQ